MRITESTGHPERSMVKHEESSRPYFARHLNTDVFTLADLQDAVCRTPLLHNLHIIAVQV